MSTTRQPGDGFGVLVRSRRQAAGLSQEGLAELAGVSVRTVRKRRVGPGSTAAGEHRAIAR